MTINLRKLKLTLFLAILVTTLLSIISYNNVQAATIGQQLLQPETGWKRYDDTDSNITYVGNFTDNINTPHYNGRCKFIESANIGDGFKFNFVGTKLRIISGIWNGCTNNISVSIDGTNLSSFSEYNSSISTLFQYLVFEKIDLPNSEHYVTISNNQSGKCFVLDAIDIDSTGELKPYNSSLNSVTSITLNKSTTDIFVGDSETLIPTIAPSDASNKNVTWISSDPTIATVDSTGKVTALSSGTAVITATTTDGSNLSSTCTVTVTPKVTTRAILTITMTNGVDKEYDLSSTEVDNFITWYDNKAAGTGTSYYTFTKTLNIAPFIKIRQYVIFDKIVSFDVSEYNAE